MHHIPTTLLWATWTLLPRSYERKDVPMTLSSRRPAADHARTVSLRLPPCSVPPLSPTGAPPEHHPNQSRSRSCPPLPFHPSAFRLQGSRAATPTKTKTPYSSRFISVHLGTLAGLQGATYPGTRKGDSIRNAFTTCYYRVKAQSPGSTGNSNAGSSPMGEITETPASRHLRSYLRRT